MSYIEEIKKQQLSSELEGLTLADLYQTYNLNAEAIELLEQLVKQGSKITSVYQLLGDLYLQTGLSQLAKKPYLQALELAKQTKDIEGQAKAQMGLGEAFYGMNNKQDAIAYLKKSPR